MSMAPAADSVYALLADRTTVKIRQTVPADFGAVKAMYEAVSPTTSTCRLTSQAAAQ